MRFASEPPKTRVTYPCTRGQQYGMKTKRLPYWLYWILAVLRLREVAVALGLSCKKLQCRLTTFHGNDPKVPVSSTSCRITPCERGTPSFNISWVLVVPKLVVADVYVDWPKEKMKWSHLRELNIPAIDSNQVGCFIGTNAPQALLQLTEWVVRKNPLEY